MNKLNPGDKIEDETENFYRRVYRKDKRYIDHRTGRPTSRAFTPRPKDDGKLSVDLASLTTPLKSIANSSRFCLWLINNKTILDLKLSAIYDPVKNNDVDNPSHCIIIGFNEEDESVPGILSRTSTKVNI
ncbi:hypothetical protein [Aureibaculum conchae]|uniref:hypothetical protein n=1 Tax=Aureibaculum sp. 2308TA14-22 TaxID=3108392 RepID=UPI00339B4A55